MPRTSAPGNTSTTTLNDVPPPGYRRRGGTDIALVTFTDASTKRRKDYRLGAYGSPESRELYHRLVAEWLANGRRWPRPPAPPEAWSITINEIVLEYSRWASEYYSPSEYSNIKAALRLLRRLFGATSGGEFGPNRLRLVRDEMIRGDRDEVPPRNPWTRVHVNGQVHRIGALFKWAASHEMLPVAVYQQLKTVTALRRGRTSARETDPVLPVPVEDVDAVRPFLSRQVRALVDLQLLTGARGGELFNLRAVDIRMDDASGVWTIEPTDHKTAHHGHTRTIYLGPKAQAVIRPFLIGRAVDAYLFSPAEAERERRAEAHANRKTPLSCGNRPGTNRTKSPRRAPGDHYDAASYRRAIARAADQAFTPPAYLCPRALDNGKVESGKAFMSRLSSEQKAELRRWRREHRWHPHQLRHTAATLIRREFGLEAARIAMGHSSALVTDAVYAERDQDRIRDIMRKIG